MQINPKLLDKIKEAVPSIMRLGFGCEVLISGIVFNWSEELQQDDIEKIIGRTITMHDIKQTLKKNEGVFMWQQHFSEISNLWNDIDDITQQSQVLIDLLEEILL